jgi:hypothetical protein
MILIVVDLKSEFDPSEFKKIVDNGNQFPTQNF